MRLPRRRRQKSVRWRRMPRRRGPAHRVHQLSQPRPGTGRRRRNWPAMTFRGCQARLTSEEVKERNAPLLLHLAARTACDSGRSQTRTQTIPSAGFLAEPSSSTSCATCPLKRVGDTTLTSGATADIDLDQEMRAKVIAAWSRCCRKGHSAHQALESRLRARAVPMGSAYRSRSMVSPSLYACSRRSSAASLWLGWDSCGPCAGAHTSLCDQCATACEGP